MQASSIPSPAAPAAPPPPPPASSFSAPHSSSSAAPSEYVSVHFRIVPENGAVQVDEVSGNSFQLGPILRKYTSAKLNVTGQRRSTTVELPLLFDCLGLLRSLQYDVSQFNSAVVASDGASDGSGRSQYGDGSFIVSAEARYACFRLTRQASAFGVRVPRPGTGTVAVPGLDDVVAYVEDKYKTEIQTARTVIAGGVTDFGGLAELFKPGTDLVDRGAATGLFGVPTAMRVRACYFSRGKSLFGVVSTFFAALEFVVSVGNRFAVVEATIPIPEFQGTRSTMEGLENFLLLTDSMAAELTRRGQMYSRLSSSGSYLQYSPGSFIPVGRAGIGLSSSVGTRSSSSCSHSGGRIMIDSQAAWSRGVHCAKSEGAASDAVRGVLKLIAQRTRNGAASAMPSPSASSSFGSEAASHGPVQSSQALASEEEESLELLLLQGPLPANLLWLTWPTIAGFSFQAKTWGVVLVSCLSEIVYNEGAFHQLVMPDSRKKLIEALILSHRSVAAAVDSPSASSASSSVSLRPQNMDLIAGKGEGTIFLLFGPPGVGKTLTAEAIAEMLHKPLYVVSMGQLGTTPESLEQRLQDVLDLCSPWGALVLIDEAEMLLERRSKNDIIRNAMVCVMLRLLEYYSGILFLTTNRVESLDPAFQSRVQCALRYEELDDAGRAKIWHNLLLRWCMGDRTKLQGIDFESLAKHRLNGRQIKNSLQLAVALSQNEGTALSQRHLEEIVQITEEFISHTSGSSASV